MREGVHPASGPGHGRVCSIDINISFIISFNFKEKRKEFCFVCMLVFKKNHYSYHTHSLTGFFSKEMKSGLNFFRATSSSWYVSGLFLYKARSTLAWRSLYGLQIPKDKIKPVNRIVLTSQLHKTWGFFHVYLLLQPPFCRSARSVFAW